MFRAIVPSACLAALAACGVAETATPPVSAPPVAPVDTVVSLPAPPPPPREPEPSPQERWAAPFAVHSSGRPAPRGARTVVVLRDSVAERPVEARTAAATPPVTSPGAASPNASTPGSRPAAAAPAPSRAAAPAPAAAPRIATARTHRVEWGETWYGIARQYEIAPRDLAAANPNIDPERLRSGQVLQIPRTSGRPAARRTHTVAQGETLWGIARRYGVSTEAIRRANRLTDDRVRLGETLTIPQGEERND